MDPIDRAVDVVRSTWRDEPNALDALAEVRRGIMATHSDETTALLWLYVGCLLTVRFMDTGAAIVDVLRRTALAGSVEQLDQAVLGIARAGGDRRAD